MRFEMWKSKAQKGAFLVFTALMIPIIFLCAGFAVDLGNAWAYKSKLQNAADAAALAGAKEYGDNGTETVDKHDDADAQAERFLIANLGNDYFKTHLAEGSTGKVRYQMKPLTQNDSTKTYYRVYLSAKTDTTFMQMFNYKHLNVGVEAVALVPSKGEGTIDFNNLIDVGTQMWGSFNNQNGRDDDWAMLHKNKIQGAVFDGTVVLRNHEEWEKARYATVQHDEWWPVRKHWTTVEDNGWYRFFTPEAKNDSSRYDAIQKNHYQWPIEGNSTDYYNKAQDVQTALEALYRNYANEIEKSDSLRGRVYAPLSHSLKRYYLLDADADVSLINLNLYITNYGSSDNPNPQGTVPTKINGQDFYVNDSPVYIYLKGYYQSINIYLTEDVTHPVVICYLGDTTIHFMSQNHNFIGTLYAPNAPVSPFNFEDHTFVGSISADKLELNSNRGYFKFWNFGIPSNGQSGNTSASSNDLKLVISDKEGLTWSDD